MKIVWERDAGKAVCESVNFTITCRVRNELNNRRALHKPKDVVRAIVNGQWGPPYMPRMFPKGTWEITGVEWTKDKDFAPAKIETNAHQLVEAWALDSVGGYDHATGERVDDSGYHLHWAEFSKTTLGCGRVGKDTDEEVRLLASAIEDELQAGNRVYLEVL